MRSCTSTDQRTARVGGGALLGDVDHETQAFGLATPLGINSTTGFAGLCLGGGFGWLTRKYGMTIDNLISADVVTADGELHVVSSSREPDLFWAIRGGGGNFGVVTSFEIQLHPVGPLVHSGLVVYPARRHATCSRAWRDFTDTRPTSSACGRFFAKRHRCRSFLSEVHGTDVVIFAAVYAGDVEEGARATAPLLEARSAHCQRAHAESLRCVPASVRSAARAGRSQLLEVERLR